MRKALALFLLMGFAFLGWNQRVRVAGFLEHGQAWLAGWRGGNAIDLERSPVPDRERYEVMSADLERWRTRLQAQYRKAGTPQARLAAERDARTVLEAVLPELMKCWLGTPWDFNGTASGPGSEPIACGYFVSTVLKDAGFQLDRYRLAQQPSSRILTTFVSKQDCRLMVDVPYEEFASDMLAMGSGIYLVGLDTHVAFLVVDNGTFRFIHSSGAEPYCVVEESADKAEVLKSSRWRMVANLTAEPSAVKKWLARGVFAVNEG